MVNDPRPRPDITLGPTASTSDACSARSADHLSPAPKLFRPRGSSSSSSKCATKHFSNLASVGSVHKTRHHQSNCPYENKKKRTVSRPRRDPVLRRDTLADTNHAHAIVVVVLAVVLAGVEPEAQAEPARFQVEVDPRRSRNRQTQILQTKHSVSQITRKIKKSNLPF